MNSAEKHRLRYFLVSLFIGLTVVSASDMPDYSKVDAIFSAHCRDCHAAKDPEASLVLDDFESLMKGGERGAAIVPGKSNGSLLVQMIEGKVVEDGKPLIMPPGKRKKLGAEEIAAIKAWIESGAKPPAQGKAKELVVPRIVPRGTPRRPVNALAHSAAGRLVAVAGYGEVQLCMVEGLVPVRTLAGHRGNVNSLVFSADGAHLFAAAGEPALFGEIRQWNVSDGNLIRVFEGHKDALYCVALSPDGQILASTGYDQKIRLWNVGTGAEIRMLSGHNGCVYGLAFRPDGRILASASADRTVKLWEVASGQRRETFSQPLKDQFAVAFSADGIRLAAAGADNRIRIWEVSESATETTNPLLESKFAHEGAILHLAFSSDGKKLLSSADDRMVKLWTFPEMKEALVLEKQSDWPPALAFGAGDTSILVGRLDGTVGIYDAGTGKLISSSPGNQAGAEAGPLKATAQ